MTVEEFRATLKEAEPPRELAAPLAALWWDAKGDWSRGHGMVDESLDARGDGSARISASQRGCGVERGLLVRPRGAQVSPADFGRGVAGAGEGVAR